MGDRVQGTVQGRMGEGVQGTVKPRGKGAGEMGCRGRFNPGDRGEYGDGELIFWCYMKGAV